MEHMIYSYSLCVALPLMLFFGFSFLFSKTPDKNIFNNYLRSRRIMGVALLLLAVNYSMHFFFEIRYLNPNAAILMNLTTYFLCYWLFSSALTSLLNRFYITRKRFGILSACGYRSHYFPGSYYLSCPKGWYKRWAWSPWRYGWSFMALFCPEDFFSPTKRPLRF